jgi:hypothetical protein
MNILPIDRALSIYGVLADRSETKGAREQFSRRLMELYIGKKRPAPTDSPRTILSSRSGPGTRFQQLSRQPAGGD